MINHPQTALRSRCPFLTTCVVALSAVATGLPCGSTALVAAPISYASAGGTYTQNFDTLAASPQGDNVPWSDGTTIPGWYAQSNGVAKTIYKVNNGSTANVTGLHSNGSVGGGGTNLDSDRALGTQSNSTSFEQIGVAFSNNTGSALTSFMATYDGEQWRRISNEGADDYVVQYQIFGAGLGSLNAGGTWTAVPALTFNAPNVGVGGSSTALDGNAPANRVAGISGIVTGLNWGATQELWLRFSDSGSAQHQLALDNFEFSAEDVATGTVTPITLAQFSAPKTLTFETVSAPTIISGTDPLFTNFGISQVSAVGGGSGNDEQNQTGQSGNALFFNGTNLYVLPQGDNNVNFGFNQDFTLDFAEDHNRFGLSFQDQIAQNIVLSFFLDGVFQGQISQAVTQVTDTFYGFQTDFLFDRVVINGALTNDGIGIDNLTLETVAASVPEPSTLALAMLGLGCLAYWRRGLRPKSFWDDAARA